MVFQLAKGRNLENIMYLGMKFNFPGIGREIFAKKYEKNENLTKIQQSPVSQYFNTDGS